jgi:hypothetical protein
MFFSERSVRQTELPERVVFQEAPPFPLWRMCLNDAASQHLDHVPLLPVNQLLPSQTTLTAPDLTNQLRSCLYFSSHA